MVKGTIDWNTNILVAQTQLQELEIGQTINTNVMLSKK